MIFNFEIKQEKDDKHEYWSAESCFFRGCAGQGDTAKEAIEELEKNEKGYITTAFTFSAINVAKNNKFLEDMLSHIDDMIKLQPQHQYPLELLLEEKDTVEKLKEIINRRVGKFAETFLQTLKEK